MQTNKIQGRIKSVRRHGKLTFMHINSQHDYIQVMFTNDETPQYEDVFHLKVGDIVRIEGEWFVTRSKEQTIRVKKWELLFSCLVEMPEKWHGLTNPDTRYRNKWMDLASNEKAFANVLVRANVLYTLRQVLHRYHCVEVETPTLVDIPGGAIAKPFSTHHNSLNKDMFLRIAPELFLKKMLVGGFERIYEIGRCYRNEGISPRHNPEFTMCEVYIVNYTYVQMIQFMSEFFKSMHGGWTAKIVSFAELVNTNKLSDDEAMEKFETDIGPSLMEPTFVTHFPMKFSPLARANDGNPRFADRFELYIKGMEIANAYTEENDPEIVYENMKRYSSDESAIDTSFVDALRLGMPPAAGLGIGVDRLVMIEAEEESIREVITFPTLK